jgi:hypothetical protein
MSGISDLLVAANRGRRSARQVSRDAQELGYSLNHDTAARYMRGDHGVPDEATLVAFSQVLGVPMTKLRAAAGLPSEIATPYEPPAEASRMNRRQRRAVDEIIRAMVDTGQGRGNRSSDRVSNLTAAADAAKPTRRAARSGKAEPTAG